MSKGAFNNYVRGQNFASFLHTPGPQRGQKQTFFDTILIYVVHVVIEWPLSKIIYFTSEPVLEESLGVLKQEHNLAQSHHSRTIQTGLKLISSLPVPWNQMAQRPLEMFKFPLQQILFLSDSTNESLKQNKNCLLTFWTLKTLRYYCFSCSGGTFFHWLSQPFLYRASE